MLKFIQEGNMRQNELGNAVDSNPEFSADFLALFFSYWYSLLHVPTDEVCCLCFRWSVLVQGRNLPVLYIRK